MKRQNATAESLARILGPDTLELLETFVGERVEELLELRDAERRWLSVSGAADYLGLTQKAVRRRVERGTIPYTRLGSQPGSHVLIDRRALDRELEERRRDAPHG